MQTSGTSTSVRSCAILVSFLEADLSGVAISGPLHLAEAINLAMGDKSDPETSRPANLPSTKTVPPPQNGSWTGPGHISMILFAQIGCIPAG